MCYEFDEMYWKAREEAMRRKKLAEETKDKTPAPAKPVAPAPKEPVPA